MSRADVEAIIGALCRGTLRPRDLVELPARWWMPAANAAPFMQLLGELHGEILCALEASIEVHGRVRLAPVLRLLARAGWHAGLAHGDQLLGYLPGLARRGPGRATALSARDRFLWREEQRLSVHAQARSAGEVVVGVFARLPAEEQARAVAGWLAAGGGSA